MTPFQEFICDARGAWSRFVGGCGEVDSYLLCHDRGKVTYRLGGWVFGVCCRDRFRNGQEELIREDLANVGVGCGQRSVEFQEGGNLVGSAAVAPLS